MKNFEEHKKKLMLWSVLTVILICMVFGIPVLLIITVLFFGEASKRWLAAADGATVISIVSMFLILPFINLLGVIFVIPRFVAYSTCPYCREKLKPWIVLKMEKFECPHCHNSREKIIQNRKHSWEA